MWDNSSDNRESRKAENNSSHGSIRATAEPKNIFIHQFRKGTNSTVQVLPHKE